MNQNATSRADRYLATLVVLIAMPWLLVMLVHAVANHSRITRRIPTYARNGLWFFRYEFFTSLPGAKLLGLLHVFRGEMAMVGPKPINPEKVKSLRLHSHPRFDYLPGVFSPFDVQRRSGIAYSDEWSTLREYMGHRGTWSDLGVVVRSAITWPLSQPQSVAAETLKLLGIKINNITMMEAVDRIVQFAQAAEPSRVSFVNAANLNAAFADRAYQSHLEGCRLVLPDGIGIRMAGRITGQSVRDNVNGTDMMAPLCRQMQQRNMRIYLVGATADVAVAAAENISKKYGDSLIAGFTHGFHGTAAWDREIKLINRAAPDLVLIGMGSPRQERWIEHYGRHLTAPVLMGVGGLLDFEAGAVARAPIWLRELGLEWAWRMKQEPGRLWRRYILGNPAFIFRVLATEGKTND